MMQFASFFTLANKQSAFNGPVNDLVKLKNSFEDGQKIANQTAGVTEQTVTVAKEIDKLVNGGFNNTAEATENTTTKEYTFPIVKENSNVTINKIKNSKNSSIKVEKIDTTFTGSNTDKLKVNKISTERENRKVDSLTKSKIFKT